MTIKEFLLPDLGEGLDSAEVVRWLVAVGEPVAQDQPVAEVETAKAVVEVPSPFAGVVTALHAAEGGTVEVGRPLLSVDERAATPAAADVRAVAPAGVSAAGVSAPPAPGGESGSVLVGYGTGAGTGRARRRHASPQAPVHPASPPNTADAARSPAPSRPRAKPPVRKLAKDLGVDLAGIRGSGPEGSITREDVHAAAAATATAAAPTQAPARPEPERVPLRGLRKAMAERMTASRREIPEATAWVDCDATRLLRLRRRLAAAHPEVPISPLALILRACVAGLREFPALNSSLDVERGEVMLHRRMHLGFAAATERGLVVPVIKDAQRLSALRIAAELQRLTTAAREGRVTPGELTGGTFTVSNYGSFGIDGGAPVINHPEAAILGIGRIAERPWVHKGKVAPRQVVALSLAFDHRLADGAEAAGFLRLVADCIEDPMAMLAVL